jgi:leucyl aminopeptidase
LQEGWISDMEFNAIIDAKARTAAGCAVVGIYEEGDLGIAARQLDAQLGGLIGKLHAGGDFTGKLGDTLLLPAPVGALAARVLLVGLGPRGGFGRKQYRKSLQSSAQALAKTGVKDAVVYLSLEDVADLDVHYRARAVAEVFRAQFYKIPDRKTSAKPKAPRLSSIGVAVENARAAKAAAKGLIIGNAIGSGMTLTRDLANLPPNICTPTYIGTRAQALAKEWPSIKTKVLERRQEGRRADLPDRQGHHLRFGRHFPQGPAGDGRNEVRHERGGGGLGSAAGDRRARIAHQCRGDRPDLREHAERQGCEALRHRRDHVRPDG